MSKSGMSGMTEATEETLRETDDVERKIWVRRRREKVVEGKWKVV